MLPALALIAASAGLNYLNNQAAQKRRDQIRGSMEQYQRMKAAETQAATEKLLEQQTPEARSTELAKVTDERARSMQDTVKAAQATEAEPIAGKMSADFKAADARSADTVAARTKRAIEQLSTMGAPGEQGQRFNIRFGRAAGNVDAANRAAGYVGNAAMTDIGNVQPNPFIGLLSQVGMGVGTGMAAAPAAGIATSAQPNQISPNNANWGSLDDGPAAYNTRARLNRGFSLWGTR